MVNIVKEAKEVESIPDKIKADQKSQKKICEYCRFYNLSWLAFLCSMFGLVFPLTIIKIFQFSEPDANWFLSMTFIIGFSSYFIFRPYQIRKADEQYKAMNYHSHIHI